MKVLVTGAAGFIGSACARALVARGDEVIGVDNLNEYYDLALKQARLALLADTPHFRFERLELAEREATLALVARERPDAVLHVAAQAGVRASATDPYSYVRSNLLGHSHVLEAIRALPSPPPLVYASSSSVYGERADGPFSETDHIDSPASIYAATKAADELVTGVYARAFGLTVTGLRFFTVYGPLGRPDMAYWTFADALLAGRPVELYGNGLLERDFTYIDDIVAGIIACLDQPGPVGQQRIFNLGNGRPETVLALVDALERHLGVVADRRLTPQPAWDVTRTHADTTLARTTLGWAPQVSLDEGIARFAPWFRSWVARGAG